MDTQSTQRFVSDFAPLRSSASRVSARLYSTRRFVSGFAPPRSTALCASTCRCAPQLNDLLVTTTPCRNSTLLDLPHRFATPLNPTQQFVSYNSTQRGYPPCSAALRHASQRPSTQRFVSNSAACRSATPHRATRLFSTQRFVSNLAALRNALLRNTLHRSSSQLNDLLVTTTSRRRSLQRVAPQCTASHLFSTQRNRLM